MEMIILECVVVKFISEGMFGPPWSTLVHFGPDRTKKAIKQKDSGSRINCICNLRLQNLL